MSFTFNNVDFGTLGVTVLDNFELPGATSKPVRPIGLPAADKVWYEQGECEPVEITFPVRIAAATAGALQTALDLINTALTTTVDVTLSYWYTDRHWNARWDGKALRMPVLNTCTLETTIRFLAQPNMLATSPSTGNVAITINPQTIWVPGPIEASGVIAGNTIVAPILILRNTAAEIAADGLEIWNYVTGAYLDYVDSVPDETYVKFDCDTRRSYASVDGTTYTEVIGKVTTNWLTFTGGAAARLVVIGCAGGTLSWSYRGRFL